MRGSGMPPSIRQSCTTFRPPIARTLRPSGCTVTPSSERSRDPIGADTSRLGQHNWTPHTCHPPARCGRSRRATRGYDVCPVRRERRACDPQLMAPQHTAEWCARESSRYGKRPELEDSLPASSTAGVLRPWDLTRRCFPPSARSLRVVRHSPASHASAARVVTTNASATDTAVIAHATRRFSRSASCVRRGISASEMSSAGTASAVTLS